MKLYKILYENAGSEQPPKPKQEDMRDALEMVREGYPEEMENKELEDFDLEYIGKLSVDEIGQYADLSSWMEEFDEDDVEEGNRFTKGLEDDNVKVGDKIPGTNAIKKKDIDEGILASTRALWKKYQE